MASERIQSPITLGKSCISGHPASAGSPRAPPEVAAVFPVRAQTRASVIAEGAGLTEWRVNYFIGRHHSY